MSDETRAIPTVEEIMRFNHLTLRVLCNAETLPESEIDELDRLKRKTEGYDLFGTLHAAYESEKARADRLFDALKEEISNKDAVRLWNENEKLKAENEHLKQNLSEACAARDQWRETHLENGRFKEALRRIAAEDFRGPRPWSSSFAYKVLHGDEE